MMISKWKKPLLSAWFIQTYFSILRIIINISGIPDKPELAETYYSQFEDEFEGGKGVEIVVSEDESSDEEDDHSEAGDTLLAGVGEEEEEDLISCMQNALDQSDTG